MAISQNGCGSQNECAEDIFTHANQRQIKERNIMPDLIRVAVTGVAGRVGYSLVFRLIRGEVFGPQQRIALHLLEAPEALRSLEGVAIELEDCGSPLLHEIVLGDDPQKVFEGVHWALLLGGKPRGPGMERRDLLQQNGAIYTKQGQALRRAASDVRVLVVGNPANTNCLITLHSAGDLPAERCQAMTRLDHTRAKMLLARKAGVSISEVQRVTIWGNHSSTMYPDCAQARIQGRPAIEVLGGEDWLNGAYISDVQQRGAKVVQLRGISSAGAAAQAVIDHLHSWLQPTPADEWVSSAVLTRGRYGFPEGLVCSFPMRNKGPGGWEVVEGLALSAFAQERIQASIAELQQERAAVEDLLHGTRPSGAGVA